MTPAALGAVGRFRRESLIPTGAWLEGLVNAVVYRSYSLGGDHIRVEVFDDRIEIESPGRFPGVVRLDDPRGVPRFARNRRIARVCADLRFGQELGEGIRRIYDEMHLAGLGDNYATHKHENVRKWLERNKRITLHFTPTSGSWLNLVEAFFSIITRQAIRGGSFESVQRLGHSEVTVMVTGQQRLRGAAGALGLSVSDTSAA
jgi:ATP-dependent DNA helicase RecG